jgi:hypothetical protein
LSLAFSAGLIEGVLLAIADALREPGSWKNLTAAYSEPPDERRFLSVYQLSDLDVGKLLDEVYGTSDPGED